MDSPRLAPPLSLLRPGGAPPPPPKNPARLMALALAERAQQVAQRQSRQEHRSTPSASRSPFRRSLSLEVGSESPETPGSGLPSNSLAHSGAWAPGPIPSLPRQQSDGSLVRSQRPPGTSRRGLRSTAQASALLRGDGSREAPETAAQFSCPVPSQLPAPSFSAPRECLPPFLGVPKSGFYSLGSPSFQPSSPAPVWRTPLGPPALDRGENLYYEIEAGEGSPYSGPPRSWSPFRSVPPDRLNASYGMLGQSPPLHSSPDFLLSYPPPPSCFPHDHMVYLAPQHSVRRPPRPEPLYVNLALGPRGPSPASSCSSSSPPAHPRSRSDPGPPAPRLPQKQRSPWGPHTPHRVPGPWGAPEPLLLRRAAPPPYGRGSEHHRGSLYRNGGPGREGAGPPPPYPTPNWSLRSEGQTRSYC